MDYFDELEFNPHPSSMAGFDSQALIFFSNGLGASVITGRDAYGAYELAVIEGSESSYEITYSTPVTDDVIGVSSEEEVDSLLRRIESLEWQDKEKGE